MRTAAMRIGIRRRGPSGPLLLGAAIAFLGGCVLGLLSARAMGWLG
jgi:hypothetical protein